MVELASVVAERRAMIHLYYVASGAASIQICLLPVLYFIQ